MSSFHARGSSRQRRTRSEINMVPFIDVMLVLLIIFMVTAPLLPSGVVDLPSVGKGAAKPMPEAVVEVVLDDETHMRVRLNAGQWQAADRQALAQVVRDMQASAPSGPKAVPVIISAHKDVRYDAVVQVMDVLQRNGISRVGLAVHSGA